MNLQPHRDVFFDNVWSGGDSGFKGGDFFGNGNNH